MGDTAALNEIGLENRVARILILEVFRVSRQTMVQAECDAGEALFDLEGVIGKLFKEADVLRVMQTLASVAQPDFERLNF